MNRFRRLLVELEARRDIAYMDAKEARVKADTLEYTAILLRNAIEQEEKESTEQAQSTAKEADQ